MREIKFRVWDSLERTWQHSKGHSTVAFNRDGLFFPYGTGYSNTNWPNRFVAQQFTGLKDKNGKQIYDGDLIQYNQNSSYDGMNFECRWSDDSLGWIFQSKTGEVLTNDWTPKGNRFNFIEVVGNIFENPELL